MRGPQDNLIYSQGEGRPPGGKLLQRQLQWLESAGYTEVAAAAIRTAINEEERANFQELEAQFTAAPSGQSIDITRIPEPGESIGIEDIAQMYQATAERLGSPTATGPQWRSLGPTTIPNGQTYGFNRINVSGRIASVIVDPAEAAHVLVGTANGGVWESDDRGVSWSPRSDYAATLSVGILAFDPNDSSIVYCGTGEGNAWYNAPLGEGILRSTDGGTTWSTLCTTPFVGKGFYDLVVDPADSQHLLAGTTTLIGSPNGLFVSTDGGVNWTPQRTARTWSLSIAPTGGAAAEILAGCEDGVWASTNGGTTWSKVTLPGAPITFDRIEVDIAPSNPSVAYAWGARGDTAYLWRRAGGTWTTVTTPPDVRTGQASYDWFVAAAPDIDTQVYCGAIEVHRGDLTAGGWTWINISNKNASSAGNSIHPDQHAISFEPGTPNTIYVANDGGLFRSNDRGINWQHCNNGLVITEFEYLAQDPNSAQWIIGGTQDNGTQRWTGSSVHDHVADGDGGDYGGTSWSDRTAGLPDLPINAIAIDPTDDDRIWVAADLGVYQSLDGGVTWSDFSNGLPHMVVGDMLFHSSARLLRVGTRNRGIWEIMVDDK